MKSGISFQELAKIQMEQLSKQLPVTLSQARAQAFWLNKQSSTKTRKRSRSFENINLHLLIPPTDMTTLKTKSSEDIINLILMKTITSIKELNLKGNVKSIKEYKYHNPSEKFGKVKKGKRLNCSINIFNDKGKLIKKNRYNIDGVLYEELTYKYDGNGNLIEENCDCKEKSYPGRYTYRYDENGNMTEMNVCSPDGSESWISTYKHDYRNIIEGNTTWQDGKVEEQIMCFYKYDDNNNIIEKRQYSPNEEYYYVSAYKYDFNGNMIEHNYYPSNNWRDNKHTYIYDDKGNMIEKNTYDDGIIQYYMKDTYKYDDYGNIIEKNRYDENGSILRTNTYKYEYDEKLNWIKRTKFKNGALYSISEREIEYY